MSQTRLESLARQHQALEMQIKDARANKAEDALDIQTLKRKKLAIKEEMEALRKTLKI